MPVSVVSYCNITVDSRAYIHIASGPCIDVSGISSVYKFEEMEIGGVIAAWWRRTRGDNV